MIRMPFKEKEQALMNLPHTRGQGQQLTADTSLHVLCKQDLCGKLPKN